MSAARDRTLQAEPRLTGCADSTLFMRVSPLRSSALSRCGNFSIRFQRLSGAFPSQTGGSVLLFNARVVNGGVTFDNVAVNRALEVLARLLVEVLAVDDPHLFEESRLAALASAQQQDLYQPLHVRFLPGDTSVDLLRLSRLFHLAAVEQADGQANFQHGPGRQEIRHVRTNFIDAHLMRVRAARARGQAPSLNSGSSSARPFTVTLETLGAVVTRFHNLKLTLVDIYSFC